MNFGALAGLSNVYPGYLATQKQQNIVDLGGIDVENARQEQQGIAAMGNALTLIRGGAAGMPPNAPLPPMPGQASQPGGPPTMGGPPGGGMPSPAGLPGGGMLPPPVQMAGGPGGGAPMPGQPSAPPGLPPPAPGMAPRPPVPTMGQPGSMTWQQVVSAVQRANPGARPEIIARATTKMLPLMEQASKMEWRAIDQNFNERQLAQRQLENENLMERYRNPNVTSPDAIASAKFAEENPDATAEQWAAFRRTLRGGVAGAGSARNQNVEKFKQEYRDAHGGQEPPAEVVQNFMRRANTSLVSDDKAKAIETDRKQLVAQIDLAIEQVNSGKAGGPKVSGVAGIVNRAWEGLGGQALVTEDTAASDFESNIAAIKSQLPRILSGTKVTNAQDRARMEKIVRGTGAWDSPATTRSSLEFVKKMVGQSVGQDKDQEAAPKRDLPGARPPPGTAKPVPPALKAEFNKKISEGRQRGELLQMLRDQGYDTQGL